MHRRWNGTRHATVWYQALSLYSCLYLSFAYVAAFIVSLFIVLPIILCVYCCSCCTFCTVAWLVTGIHRWGARWHRNNDPTIVEVIDPQQVGAPVNINSRATKPPVRLFVELWFITIIIHHIIIDVTWWYRCTTTLFSCCCRCQCPSPSYSWLWGIFFTHTLAGTSWGHWSWERGLKTFLLCSSY